MKLRGNDVQVSMTSTNTVILYLAIIHMFRQCVILNVQDIFDWFHRKAEKYTSAEVRNKLLEYISTTVLH